MKTVDELSPAEFTLPPLHQAARQRDLQKVQELLNAGANVNEADPRSENGEGGNSPLWYAAQGIPGGGVPVAQLLIDAGAEVNAPGEFDRTPLHMACSWGHCDMVQFLHQHGEIAQQVGVPGLKAWLRFATTSRKFRIHAMRTDHFADESRLLRRPFLKALSGLLCRNSGLVIAGAKPSYGQAAGVAILDAALSASLAITHEGSVT